MTDPLPWLRPERVLALEQLAAQRILVVDGAMGTSLQAAALTAADFGGAQYEGCNEHLVLTRPDVVRDVHLSFLEAGADMVETDRLKLSMTRNASGTEGSPPTDPMTWPFAAPGGTVTRINPSVRRSGACRTPPENCTTNLVPRLKPKWSPCKNTVVPAAPLSVVSPPSTNSPLAALAAREMPASVGGTILSTMGAAPTVWLAVTWMGKGLSESGSWPSPRSTLYARSSKSATGTFAMV